MENYLTALDEYFSERFADYTRICAIAGYRMPNMVDIGRDGNLVRKDSSYMSIARQPNAKEVLENFKATLIDTDIAFGFYFRPGVKKLRRTEFSKLLPDALARCGETLESAGEKLDMEPKFRNLIFRGKLCPEKNTVLAIALVSGMQAEDAERLLAVCGFTLDDTSVRDVVTRYLIEQKIFNDEMRNNCLAEYKITCLPIGKSREV